MNDRAGERTGGMNIYCYPNAINFERVPRLTGLVGRIRTSRKQLTTPVGYFPRRWGNYQLSLRFARQMEGTFKLNTSKS